ncbi:MAG TPA: BLUF domain-containing protein [Paracoccus sp. (in: a-proteobacteria)]|nr:BLUF domain-containing protein [Paracoccus sp. (in: a-proteobacteria)]
MTDLAFLLYRSETTMPPLSDAARDLLATARRVNAGLGLTGFLHHEDGFFFQWLEGPAEPLDMIAGRLEADPRHFNLTWLWRGTETGRQFAGWKMGYSTRDDSSIMGWLVAHPVAQRERQAYAASVLAFLQERNGQTA